MAANEKDNILVEEREEEMVAFLGSKQPINRKGWFLKPTSNSIQSPIFIPSSSHCTALKTPKCSFKGWVCSQRTWDKWVEKLRPNYSHLWKKVGILDAINASKYRFKRDQLSIWGVVKFWCEQTNTFIFPWAEASITLEDVMILGGFSVLGEPVRVSGPLEGELGELGSLLAGEVKKFNQSKSKKAEFSAWMKHYIVEGSGDELEHVAFLAMWLSRFVLLAPPGKIVGYHVIPVAVRLARGTKIALAPAVLASLYRDLRVMKDYLATSAVNNSPSLIVWAPLHILQLWIWERFLALRPETSSFVNLGEPRVARWQCVRKKLDYQFIKSVIKSPDEIQWRPYLACLDHWCNPSYSRDEGGWIYGHDAMDEGIESFARCIKACELVGLDCIEQYFPHRVSRQFGLDQDIPHSVPRANSTWEVAWRTYAISGNNVKYFVPSKLFESDVTLEYSVWWDSVRKLLKKKMKGKKRKKTHSLQCCYTKELQDADDVVISDWIARKKQRISSKNLSKTPPELSTTKKRRNNSKNVCKNSPEFTTALNYFIENRVICGELESLDTRKQDSDALSNVNIKSEAVESNALGIDDKGVEESSDTRKQYSDSLSNIRVENEAVKSNTLKFEDKGVVESSDIRKQHSDSLSNVNDQNEAFKSDAFDIDDKGLVEISDTRKQDADALSNVDVKNEAVKSNALDIEKKEFEECSDTREQYSDALNNFKVEHEAVKSNELDIEDKGAVEHIEETSAGDSVSDPIVTDEIEENFEMAVEESTSDGKSETELEIEKLKEEIALIHARVKSLESLAESENLVLQSRPSLLK
ncbi:uncharacterized protein LOC109827349 isoform X1 [Asparagus officinalis]|uniref:uncharacterized protein LOC109827349 isoform X1 n=1 Tax=Asparagus officinalis TaxID=4686 RepID=UPI00098E51C0|nr:uncharacterized protein LOC109827349 isoform X1 [Asparagus officinalis]